jgi:hypothetical protein
MRCCGDERKVPWTRPLWAGLRVWRGFVMWLRMQLRRRVVIFFGTHVNSRARRFTTLPPAQPNKGI